MDCLTLSSQINVISTGWDKHLTSWQRKFYRRFLPHNQLGDSEDEEFEAIHFFPVAARQSAGVATLVFITRPLEMT